MTDNVDVDPGINSWESKKIQILLFYSIFLLAWIHGVNTSVFFFEPGISFATPMNLTDFIEVFISHGLLRWRVPLFLFVRGIFLLDKKKKNVGID